MKALNDSLDNGNQILEDSILFTKAICTIRNSNNHNKKQTIKNEGGLLTIGDYTREDHVGDGERPEEATRRLIHYHKEIANRMAGVQWIYAIHNADDEHDCDEPHGCIY